MEEAQYHFTSRALSRMNRDRGILVPLDAPDVAATALQAYDQGRVERFRKDSFVGTGPEVAARIEELKNRVGVDEMAVVTWTHDEEVRRASYTHLAPALGFSPANSSPPGASHSDSSRRGGETPPALRTLPDAPFSRS